MENKMYLYAYSFIKNTINFFIFCLIFGFLLFLGKDKFEFIENNFEVLAIIAVVFLIIDNIILGSLEVKHWHYEWNEEKIRYQKGYLVIKQVLIPMLRVQQITTVTNPLLKSWGLVEIQIITTTETHTLLPIDKNEAEEFKNILTSKLVLLQNLEAGEVDE